MGYSDDPDEEVLTKDRRHGARGVNITTSDVEIMTKNQYPDARWTKVLNRQSLASLLLHWYNLNPNYRTSSSRGHRLVLRLDSSQKSIEL